MRQQIRIVLVETSHPGNIGAAARAMKNMGLEELVLVSPAEHPSAEATSRASGAADLLERARVVDCIAAAVGDCRLVLATSARPRSANWRVFDPGEAARRLTEACAEGPVAVLFGNERNGLSNEQLGHCHALLNIPSNPDYESLNLAQAVQLVTWEIRRQQGVEPRRLAAEAPPATAAQLAHLSQHFRDTLPRLGFEEPRNLQNLVQRIDRLLARAHPDEKEVQILRGILTAIDQRTGGTGT
ncbi:MAG: RNA methyltransferase [Steroidobacteraceae bacterium]